MWWFDACFAGLVAVLGGLVEVLGVLGWFGCFNVPLGSLKKLWILFFEFDSDVISGNYTSLIVTETEFSSPIYSVVSAYCKFLSFI